MSFGGSRSSRWTEINYDTFIRVAPDCPASEAVVPTGRRELKAIPQVGYESLSENPYNFTQEGLLFALHVRRQGSTRLN